MKRLLALSIIATFVALTGCHHGTQNENKCKIAENKKTDYVIIVPKNAIESEKFAAKELSDFLGKSTGAKFILANKLPLGKKGIFVGRTDFAKSHGVNFSKLGNEEWIIQMTNDGCLIIAGGRPRGTLYGTYEFLEKYIGCHWLDEDTEVIPKRTTLAIPVDINIRQKPAFRLRSIITYRPADREKFKLYHARNKYNYAYMDAPLGFSCSFGSPGMCHTFYKYSKDWPKDHPEYFSMDKSGKRLRAKDALGPGQICLSNPEVRKLFLKKLKAYIKEDRKKAKKKGSPPPMLYDISHNDNREKCVCPECMKIAEKYGAYSGLMLDFINELADGIKKDYPNVQLQTFAYTFTEDPPKGIRARDNVVIRMAFLGPEFNQERDTLRPLSNPNNAHSRKLIKDWSKFAKNLSIWDYWVLYREPFPSPYTNISAIKSNLQFYKNKGVKDMLVESEYPEKTCFFELKRWFGLKMMQDPERATEPLIKIFMKGYYGKAAPLMEEYLNYIERRMKEVKGKFALKNAYERKYLDLKFFKHSEELLNKAEKMTADSPKMLAHVREERVATDGALLHLWKKLKSSLPSGEKMPFDKNKVIERYRENMFAVIEKYNDPLKWPDLKKKENEKIKMLCMSVPLPEEFKGKKKVVDILWPSFKKNMDPKKGVDIVSDNTAAGGKALKLGNTKYHPKNFHAPPLRFGVYSANRKEFGPSAKIEKSKLPKDEKYHLYKIGRFNVGPKTYLWTHKSWIMQNYLSQAYDALDPEKDYDIYVSFKVQGPAYVEGSKKENAIFMDRIILVKQEKNN